MVMSDKYEWSMVAFATGVAEVGVKALVASLRASGVEVSEEAEKAAVTVAYNRACDQFFGETEGEDGDG